MIFPVTAAARKFPIEPIEPQKDVASGRTTHRVCRYLAGVEGLSRSKRSEKSFGRHTRARDATCKIDQAVAFAYKPRRNLQTSATRRQNEASDTYWQALVSLACTVGAFGVIDGIADLVRRLIEPFGASKTERHLKLWLDTGWTLRDALLLAVKAR